MMLRRGGGFAEYWLRGHRCTFDRYIKTFYTPFDWGRIKFFLKDNPIQTMIMLEDYEKSNGKKQEMVLDIIMRGKSKIIYLVGARGKGKSCTSGWIINGIHNKDKNYPIYMVGEGIAKVYPEWVHYKDSISQVPNGSFIVLDEASIRYSAREFFKQANILLGKMLAIARHKELSVLFITQHVNLIDINIRRLRDIVLWKPSNDYSMSEGGGRADKQKNFWAIVRTNMAPRSKEECLFEYPAEKRFIHFKHEPPIWWTETISSSFKDFKFEEKKEEVSDSYTKL